MGWRHTIADGLLVRKLRAHHARGRAPTQASAELALRDIDAEALGLPPSAWLVVRHVACVGRHEALLDALTRQRRQAARPWHEEVATDCPAVWFADEAELLACLVRDSLRGPVLHRWWWRSVLAGADRSSWLLLRMTDRGELLVAVVVLLLMDARPTFGHVADPVETWFAQLSDAQAEQAVDAVARAYAMATVGALASPTGVGRSRPERPEGLAPVQGVEPRELPIRIALQRLSATVPEVRSLRLRPPARRLLAQVLALVRAPAWARSAQFAQALHHVERIEVLPLASVPYDNGACEETLPRPAPTTSGFVSDKDVRGAVAGQQPPPGFKPPRLALRQERSAPRELRRTVADALSTTTSAIAQHSPLTDDVIDPTIAATPADEQSPHARSREPSPDIHPTVSTEFGGLFYLLNAAISLGLYGDFTAPRSPGLSLSPWDWLALVGRVWFGKTLVGDPVWALLASLAGRRACEQPGHDFSAPTDWRLNPDWLKPWGPVPTLLLRVGKRRLQVLHTAGFVVFDVARDPILTPRQHALSLCHTLKPLRSAALIDGPGLALPRPGTARWLRCLRSHLQARLTLALGSDTPHNVPNLVCRHGARITVSASEVDVTMRLADLPLSIRIAGLDRDTGWIPAAGRSLRFHFTQEDERPLPSFLDRFAEPGMKQPGRGRS